MLRSCSEILNYTTLATDGPLGKLKDILFDDRHWIIRYLVVDTGRWLPGRRVLLVPEAVTEPDWAERTLPVSLTRAQVENSPEIGEHQPVSQQHETELHRFYGWSPYWAGHGMATPPIPTAAVPRPASEKKEKGDDPHLRSAREVTGYHISALDGEIGHVEDFILDDGTWWIRYLVVDTKNWLPGKKVLVSPQWLAGVSWDDRTVSVDLTREKVRESPEYDPHAPVNRVYEERLYDFYGRPGYWR